MSSYSYYVYILTNQRNTTLYTGISNNILRRTYEHKQKQNPKSFTSKYNINKLVHYEEFDDIGQAIQREKQIKSWSREKKAALINQNNPEWRDLYDELDY